MRHQKNSMFNNYEVMFHQRHFQTLKREPCESCPVCVLKNVCTVKPDIPAVFCGSALKYPSAEVDGYTVKKHLKILLNSDSLSVNAFKS